MMRFGQSWQNVRSSFWFLPGLMVLSAVALAITLVEVDVRLGERVFERWPRLFGAGAAGARSLLATVASSMITVAGVVFSITIVALALASSQYSSGVIRNFMRDRVTQAGLGTFVGIFAYCLVVLRTIRAGDEGEFVPSLAVLVGLLLAFVGIAMLIYFIHHIATSIQATHILAAVADETLRAVDHLFPEGVGDDDDAEPEPGRAGQVWHSVPVGTTGYIQSFDTAGLLDLAREWQAVLRMERAVGQFVIEGTPLASVLRAAALDEDELRRIGSLYAISRQRKVAHDARFGIRQIVDVALKALSSGVNDTTNAVMCIDYLTAILVRLTDRRIASCYRSEDGELRLLTCGPTYASMVGDAFDQIRQNADGNLAVLEGLLGSVELLASRATPPLRRRVLLEHARAVTELCRRSIPAPRDRQRIDDRSARTIELLGGNKDA
ncbi:MAG: DUF2254 domain-containing protein [Acidobacteria bacterium]|nr:DUF2254 domain-containing protein [Acidobacteriota bacterium]